MRPVCNALSISPVCLLGGPWGSARPDILSRGAVCIRIGAVRREGPSGQARVPILSGLGHKHIVPWVQALSGQ